jgi:hypothetical protein
MFRSVLSVSADVPTLLLRLSTHALLSLSSLNSSAQLKLESTMMPPLDSFPAL